MQTCIFIFFSIFVMNRDVENFLMPEDWNFYIKIKAHLAYDISDSKLFLQAWQENLASIFLGFRGKWSLAVDFCGLVCCQFSRITLYYSARKTSETSSRSGEVRGCSFKSLLWQKGKLSPEQQRNERKVTPEISPFQNQGDEVWITKQRALYFSNSFTYK